MSLRLVLPVGMALAVKRVWIVVFAFAFILLNAGILQAQVSPGRTKVGVFVSLYSAKGPSWWDGQEIGFSHVDVARKFNDTSKYELFALVDPGTENNTFIQEQLRRFHFSAKVLDASKVSDLQQVQVMVSGNWQVNIEWSVLDAITKAVQSGVHLINEEHFGLIRPGYATGCPATKATWASHMNKDIESHAEEVKKYKERMTLLFGLTDPQFVWHLSYLDWKVSNKNYILSRFKNVQSSANLGINGLVGTSVSNQPFELVNSSSITDQWDGRTVNATSIDPFSVHRCGRGLAINISLVGDFKSLGSSDREDFVKQCADWAVTTSVSDPVGTRPEVGERIEIVEIRGRLTFVQRVLAVIRSLPLF
ncbi:TPA: hypothetical protein DDW35_04120 [Candidatus Sumerlaeota bacterium]|nr:hypothetical protein [Candidatus Sumerlaeota bacterium]